MSQSRAFIRESKNGRSESAFCSAHDPSYYCESHSNYLEVEFSHCFTVEIDPSFESGGKQVFMTTIAI